MTLGSEEVDFSRLHVLGNAGSRGTLHFDPETELDDPNGLLLGRRRPAEPLVLRRASGKSAQDLMGATYVGIKLVSQAFVDMLLDERFTGWATYPVRLYGQDGRELPGYHGLAVTGRAGPVDRSRSRIERLPPPVPQGQAMYAEIGMYFDPTSWDGRDFFIPAGTAAVCVVDRVRRALEHRGLTNLEFEPLSERQGKLYDEDPREVRQP